MKRALLRLWREKRGETEPEDLSGNLIVQLGLATEDLNRRWYEANTGQVITDIQRQVRHPTVRWMGATLDGRVEATGAVFEGQIHAALVVLGGGRHREAYGAAAAQHVGGGFTGGGAVGDHRRRKVGGNHHLCRSALPAPHRHGRAEILALRRERRAPSPIRGRAAETAHPGGPDCRHERLQRLGGIRRHLCPDRGPPTSSTSKPRPSSKG